jgi:hypothetical protein
MPKVYTFVICDNTMKTVSLKIEDSIFGETEKIRTRIKISRNRYINEALDHYNRVQHRQILEQKLTLESKLVKAESLNTLNDFEDIDYVD